VQVGEADGDQQVLGQNKAEGAGFVFAFARLLVRRYRDRDGEDTIFILKPAGEFDFLQLFARRDIQLIIGAGAIDFFRGGIVQVHPPKFAAGCLVFLEH
jgi:hypothetical protein